MKKKNKKTKRKTFNPFPALIFLLVGLGLMIGFGNRVKDNNTKPVKKVSIIKPFVLVPIESSIRVPILLYHYVEYVQDKKDTIRKSLTIPPHIFAKQVETLKNAGYTFMTMSQVAEVMDGKIKLPDNPIVLTFDDGYRDFYTDVFPILEKIEVKAVAYIVSDFIDKPNFMTTPQIMDIAKSGLVEIGAHTVHHAYLNGLPFDTAFFEINKSKENLENLLHTHIVSFAYPYGAVDNQAKEIVKNAGFKTGIATKPGIEIDQSNRFEIRRLRIGQRIDDELLNFLKQTKFEEY